ncbi:MAG TPA: hypothetical protein VNT75_31450 [Symbiobacteriaceae bacterium]|nr:hypothetical protein [Symbiobacteriaceae bacterium]
MREGPLYCSIYRFDAEMMVTPHLYGTKGDAAPLLWFKQTPDGLFDKYQQHFEQVWERARKLPHLQDKRAG